jgi:hypothetical protein
MPRTHRSRVVPIALALSVLTVAACAGRGATRDEVPAPPAATTGVPGASVAVATERPWSAVEVSAMPAPSLPAVGEPTATPVPRPTPDLSAIDLAGIDALLDDLTRSLADDATSATEEGSPE